ncbi:MAG TPA: protein-L-isoaspartate O-methyltransferase [Candidatus Sulfotelmatobacter sp.]|nr:protein-L-isoaspartate O-methyltransferase [Candidatus Sulfotelmatobacter sp.]
MPTSDMSAARRNMVDSQLKPNKVVDARVLAAMATVPRERFAPAALQGVAYSDEDIPLGQGRYLIEPMVLARLLQAAEIAGGEKVLALGAGTGYGAAVMARLAARVVALESDAALAGRARGLLGELGCSNVAVVGGALEAGCAAEAPYDVIVLEGAVESLPEALPRQLAPGGRLVGVMRRAGIGKATLCTRLDDGRIAERILFDAATPCLPGFVRPAQFVF